ncbi:hypothetical protein ACFW04_014448 [Cataglyphis niger]
MSFPQSHRQELIELAQTTRILTIPGVLGIILELLELQVSPEDIYILLKQIATRASSRPTINEGAHVSNEK